MKPINIKDIDENEYYSASRIIKNGWFPWIRSALTFVKMLKIKKARDLYKPIIRKAGRQTRYYIKGEIILDVISKSEDGTLEI